MSSSLMRTFMHVSFTSTFVGIGSLPKEESIACVRSRRKRDVNRQTSERVHVIRYWLLPPTTLLTTRVAVH